MKNKEVRHVDVNSITSESKNSKTTGKKKKPLSRSLSEHCVNCQTNLLPGSQALFVEEEVGRVFCSEECITKYFSTDIERLERDYFGRRPANDITPEQREEYAHLRWITLQEPDEIWQEKTLAGDFRYTLVSEFKPGNQTVWSVCICLFLKSEPSFLFLAFVTKSESMVREYRKGSRVEWVKPAPGSSTAVRDLEAEVSQPGASDVASDGLARDGWSTEETFRAQAMQLRGANDIPKSQFEDYRKCLEPTLEAPDEVWSQEEKEGRKLYHFIKYFAEKGNEHFYVVVARDTDSEEEIELLEAFPTTDESLADHYRRGAQEVGEDEEARPITNSRLVH